MTPLLGFSPDVEPTTPGAMLDCSNLVPYEAGMKAAPSAVSVGMPALASACAGSAVLRTLTGTSRLLAGTATNLYEAVGTSWVSQGSGYTLGSDDRWSFVSFGNSYLASSPSTGIQRSTGAAFSAIAGAPKAKCIVSAKGFVLAFATNEGTYGDSPDRWWCSALYDETSWTPSIATQANTGRLIGGSGALTAAVRFGDDVVAYKNRAMFLGTYVGGDVTWNWNQVGFDVGCVGPEACADTSIGHIFVGSDDIYKFDGTRPVPIASGVIRQWWMDNSSAEYRFRTKLLWDRDNQLVWIFFPSGGSTGACDDCIVFHVGTGKWGRVTATAQALVNYVSPSWTYNGGHPVVADYATLPDISFDSPFWLSAKTNPALFDGSGVIKTLTGVPVAWSFETGDYGDEAMWSYCAALRVRFAMLPEIMSCIPSTKVTSGAAASVGTGVAFDGSKFPLRQTARFHSFEVIGVGAAKFSAVAPALSDAGVR